MPICDRSNFWKRTPVERIEKYKALDLKSVGAECQVSEKAILKLHDRKEILQLKYFSSCNSSVSRGPMVETKVKNGGVVSTIADYNWSPISSLKNLQDSIINFGLVNQMLYPYDQTGYILLKLYNSFHWIPMCPENRRIQLISDHFNMVSEANASRACRQEAPCDYDEVEKLFKKLLENHNLPSNPVSAAEWSKFQTDQKSSNWPKNAHQKPSTSQGFTGNSNASPIGPGGKFICYDYNNRGTICNRQKVKGGCKDRTGKEFAHICLFFNKATKNYCFANHSRVEHR